MKLVKQLAVVALGTVLISSCIKVEVGDEIINNGGGTDSTSKVLNGTIDQSRTLTKGVYTLKGYPRQDDPNGRPDEDLGGQGLRDEVHRL